MRTCVRMRWETQNISSDDEGRLPGMGETVVRRFDAPEALNMLFDGANVGKLLVRVA